MKDFTIHRPLLDYFSYLTIYGDRGDLAQFGKNATHIMIFSPILCLWGRKITTFSMMRQPSVFIVQRKFVTSNLAGPLLSFRYA